MRGWEKQKVYEIRVEMKHSLETLSITETGLIRGRGG